MTERGRLFKVARNMTPASWLLCNLRWGRFFESVFVSAYTPYYFAIQPVGC
nr:hypothetical protein [Aeromonas veronii]